MVRDLLYLQENRIATRDVKTENVILTPHEDNLFHYKIADFGFARPIGGIGAKTHCGTEKYMAP